MNSTGKLITAIALIGLGLLLWPSPTPPSTTEVEVNSDSPSSTQKSSRRRARTGPRKPPILTLSPDDPPEPTDEAVEATADETVENSEAAAEDENGNDDGLTPQERKLEEYLEHLEALDDPNVDEKTMLGEMAFDANEAEAAYDHYLDVIDNHTDDPQAPFALYKLAWTEYNLGDVDAAIDDMELVIEWMGDSDHPMHDMLRGEGARDLDKFRADSDPD